jgi:hypothetical protein
LDSSDPSLVNTGEQLQMRYIAQSDTTIIDHIDTPARRSFISNKRHAKLRADLIAERFGISHVRAQQTLRVTTQRGVRSAILPISRRYRADRVLGVNLLNGKFATDKVYGKICSLRGNTGTQLFSHKCGFKAAYPIQKIDGDNVGNALIMVRQNILLWMAHQSKRVQRLASWMQYESM